MENGFGTLQVREDSYAVETADEQSVSDSPGSRPPHGAILPYRDWLASVSSWPRRSASGGHRGRQIGEATQDVIEGRLIQIGLRALELGNNVVIDYGLWGRDERSALRQAAADRGAKVEMCYFEVTPVEQRRRLDQGQDEAPHTTWPMSDEELAEWATTIDIPTPGELDGSEPIDDPPAGVATWAAEDLDEWKSSDRSLLERG